MLLRLLRHPDLIGTPRNDSFLNALQHCRVFKTGKYSEFRHSCERRNPEKKKDWIPHQVRNDRNKVTLQQATGDIKFNAFVLVLVGDNI